MTIEERAKEYSQRNFDGFYSGMENAEYDAYVVGSKKQREIDIENACQWFTDYLFDVLGCPDDWCRSGEEEFKKAMNYESK